MENYLLIVGCNSCILAIQFVFLHMERSECAEILTKLANTKITSIMKTTKRFAGEYIIEQDALFFSASYQDIRKDW